MNSTLEIPVIQDGLWGDASAAAPSATLNERARSESMHAIRDARVEFDGAAAVGDMYTPEEIGLRSDVRDHTVAVIGEFALPGESDAQNLHVAILRVSRKIDGDVRFALQGLVTDTDGRAIKSTKRPVPLTASQIQIGRAADKSNGDKGLLPAAELWGEGVLYPEYVSPNHVQISVEGNAVVLRDTSENGTWVSPNAEMEPEDEYVAFHTLNNIAKAAQDGYLDQDGKFQGRDVVTRNTTMGGKNPEATVDIRALAGGAEATVVDAIRAGELEKQGYNKLTAAFYERLERARLAAGNAPLEAKTIAELIYETVSAGITYDPEYADATAALVAKNSNNGSNKVNLGWYLYDGKGVCRHMALASAWLGGELVDKGLLRGRVTAEVNQRLTDNLAHEWARFTDDFGEVYIIDPAQNYFGKLEDTLKLSDDKDKRWHYFRDDERRIMEARIAAREAQRGSIIDEVPGIVS